MLKNIPACLSPELMKVMMEMGHGDELLLADANFPAVANGRRVIRCDGLPIPMLLEAILQFFPLDYAEQYPVYLMEPVPDRPHPEQWSLYHKLLLAAEPSFGGFTHLERFSYYDRARQAFAIVATGDRTPRGNVLLRKGVV